MKTHLHIVFIFCFVFSIQAQNSKTYSIIRSNLGTSGSSKVITTNKGKYSVSQSIGQSSVIGTSSNNGYYLRQGYQQPLNSVKVISLSKNNDLTATVYPNPFDESVSISFNEDIENDIAVSVFDIAGKLIYIQKFSPAQRIELNLNDISSGSYLLKVLSSKKRFNAKLIKN
jgi:hypothetical protein